MSAANEMAIASVLRAIRKAAVPGMGDFTARLIASAAVEAAGVRPDLPRVHGVSRMVDNDKAILISFAEPLRDDQLRALHEFLRAVRA